MASVLESGSLDRVDTQHADTCSGEHTSRYVRLGAGDRQAAETLNKYFQANATADQSALRLADLAFIQSLVTAIPLALADFLSLYLSVFLTTAALERLMGISTMQVEHQTAFFISLVILPVGHLAGLYPGIGHNPIVEFRQIARSLFVSLAVLAGIGWFCFPDQWAFYCLSAAVSFVFALPGVVAGRWFTRRIAKKVPFWGFPTLILAEPGHARDIYRMLKTGGEQGFRPVGVLVDPDEYWSDRDRLQADGIPTFDLRRAGEIASEKGVTCVIVAPSSDRSVAPALTPALTPSLAAIPRRILLSSDRFDLGIWDHAYSVGASSGLSVAGVQPSTLKLLLKRLFDVTQSVSALVVGAPFLALLWLLVRLSSKGPVFYGQDRIGRGGKVFTAWKFRTMYLDAENVLDDYLDTHPAAKAEWDRTHKLSNDPRVTWIGRFLRGTSLDELPQLWNVIVGEMSLVGPRPIVDSVTYDACYINDYPAEFEAYKSVRPGLTGLWQVRCRNRGVYEMRIYYDMYYIRNWCIWLDLYLIMRTIRTVLFREGT